MMRVDRGASAPGESVRQIVDPGPDSGSAQTRPKAAILMWLEPFVRHQIGFAGNRGRTSELHRPTHMPIGDIPHLAKCSEICAFETRRSCCHETVSGSRSNRLVMSMLCGSQ